MNPSPHNPSTFQWDSNLNDSENGIWFIKKVDSATRNILGKPDDSISIPKSFWNRPHSIMMQEPLAKDKRIKNIVPKIYREAEVKKINDVRYVMNFNWPTDITWQDRHIFLEPNHGLMKIWRNSVLHWACVPGKELANDNLKSGGAGIVCGLQHLVNKNYKQEGLVRIVEKLRMEGLPVLLHFPWFLQNK